MYAIVDTICMGLLELWGAQAGMTKFKNFLPTAEFESLIFPLRSDRDKHCTERCDSTAS